jgi:hypothetical protein
MVLLRGCLPIVAEENIIGKKSAPPPAPDYKGAAEATAASSAAAQSAATTANRPNVNTPWGSETWTQAQSTDPATGKPVTNWTQNINLSPAEQATLTAQQNVALGKANIANSSIGRMQEAYSQPFDWGNLSAMGQAPQGGQLANVGTTSGQFQNMDPSQWQNQLQGLDPSKFMNQLTGAPQAGGLMSGFDTSKLPAMGAGSGGWSGTINGGATGALNLNDLTQQRGAQVDSSKLGAWGQGVDASVGDASRQRYEQMLMDKLRPENERAQQALELKLANQGLTPGSAAYKRAMELQGGIANKNQLNVFEQGGREQQNQFGMALQGSQLANAMRQQGLGEQLAIGNQADQQRQAQLNEIMQREGLVNTAHQLRSSDQTSTGNLANQSASIANQGVQIGNQAAMDMFNQQMGMANLYNQTQGQAFNQGMQQAGMQNQNALTGYNMGMGAAGLANQNAQTGYNMGLGAAGMNNQNAQNAFGQSMQQAGMFNQNQGTMFNQDMQTANYQNQLRQQQIAEQQMQRNQPLNEMNAILSGTQIGMPQMPGFNQAQAGQATNYLGAAQMQGQAEMDAYNAKQQQSQGMMSGLGGLASAGIMAF